MTLTDFHFIRPLWLLAFIPSLILLVLMLRAKLSQGNWSAVCDAELLPYLLQEKALKHSRSPLTIAAVAAALAIMAAAGPSWQRLPTPVFRNESALVIALDLSPSMDAQDIKPSRLIRARYKIADLLKQRRDGLTALLVYSDAAFTVTPLTHDTATIDSQLSALTTDIMPSEGNNAEQALEKAVELFKNAGAQQGQIILITDGVEGDAAVKVASHNAANYPLSVLGVGTADGAPIALPEGGFLKDKQGAIVVPQLNISELTKLAQAGGGVYQTLSADDTDSKALLTVLEQPQPQQGTEQNSQMLEQWEDKGAWLLLLVLPLAALSFRKGLLCLALLVLLPLPKNSYAVEWQDLWQTKDQQAQQAFQQQHFKQAAEQFEQPEWKAAAYYKAGDYDKAAESLQNDQKAVAAYLKGNALAKSGKLEEAITAYEKALAINPNDADAKYNKELVEKELQKQQQKQPPQDDKQQQSDKNAQQDKSKQGEKSDNQKSSEQSAKDQKPEQKPERKPADDKAEATKKPEQKQAKEAQQQAEKAQKSDPQKPDKAAKQAATTPQPSTETQQANEQWLNRIPDDPAGLLKRKFKYQYGQRNQ